MGNWLINFLTKGKVNFSPYITKGDTTMADFDGSYYSAISYHMNQYKFLFPNDRIVFKHISSPYSFPKYEIQSTRMRIGANSLSELVQDFKQWFELEQDKNRVYEAARIQSEILKRHQKDVEEFNAQLEKKQREEKKKVLVEEVTRRTEAYIKVLVDAKFNSMI